MRRRLPELLVAAAVLALALRERLTALGTANTGSDALGQFLAALAFQRGWLPPPPNPEAGPGLWLLAVPLVHLAGSLESLFRLRLAVAALAAALGALAAARLAGERPAARLAAAAFAGVALARDGGLTDTARVAFRGYGAPELLAAATLLLPAALAGRAAAAAGVGLLLVLAGDQHPLALGAAAGAVLAVAPALPRRPLLALAGAGGLALVPRLARTARLARCGAGGPLDCLARVALGSAEPGRPAGEMLARALHDRLAVDLGAAAALVLGAGLLAAARYRRPAAAWALGALAGTVALGLPLHTLRPYHLRIAAAPVAAAAGAGLAAVHPVLALAGAAAWPLLARPWIPPPEPRAPPPAEADRVAALLPGLPGPLRVDAAWMDRPEGLEPAAVVLAAVLQGQDPDRFRTAPGVASVLVLNGVAGPPGPELARGAGWTVYAFPDASAAARWMEAALPAPPARVGGAWDWMAALHPREATLEGAAWPAPPQ